MFYPIKLQRSCHVQHCTCYQNLAMFSIFYIEDLKVALKTRYSTVSHYNIHRELQYKRFSNFYFMELLKCKPLYFTWRSTIESKTVQVKDLMGLQTMLEKAMNQKSFIRLYRSDPAMYSTVPATKIWPCIQFSLLK